MQNKRLGFLIITISLIFGIFLFNYGYNLYKTTMEIDCSSSNYNEKCSSMESTMSLLHIGFALFGFIASLGFYILFFDRTEKTIMDRLEKDKEVKFEELKFSIILKALDPFEQRVVKAVKEQDGITQSTLRLRTDMSKAKLSYVLQELERRGIVKRIEKGKTMSIHLKI